MSWGDPHTRPRDLHPQQCCRPRRCNVVSSCHCGGTQYSWCHLGLPSRLCTAPPHQYCTCRLALIHKQRDNGQSCTRKGETTKESGRGGEWLGGPCFFVLQRGASDKGGGGQRHGGGGYRDSPPRLGGEPDAEFGKKSENGIFGISVPRGFRKVIICHVFGGKQIDHFQCSKTFSAP